MDSTVFNLGLSDDALSLYMILDHLQFFGKEAVPEQFKDRWQQSEEKFAHAVAELVLQRIVEHDGSTLQLMPVSHWQAAKSDS